MKKIKIIKEKIKVIENRKIKNIIMERVKVYELFRLKKLIVK